MARKRTLLPADFGELPGEGELAGPKAVFDTCALGARGGSSKAAALAFSECPDALTRWLVERGGPTSAPRIATARPRFTPGHAAGAEGWPCCWNSAGTPDAARASRRGTPLHRAADGQFGESARLPLAHGARVDALSADGLTPLEYGLQRCSSPRIAAMVGLAEQLPAAGARTAPRAKQFVTRIATDFELHRARYDRDAVSAAPERLCALFDVPPVPRRATHDGSAPIVANAAGWRDRHRQLWEMPVPSRGAAPTVQGEVVRAIQRR